MIKSLLLIALIGSIASMLVPKNANSSVVNFVISLALTVAAVACICGFSDKLPEYKYVVPEEKFSFNDVYEASIRIAVCEEVQKTVYKYNNKYADSVDVTVVALQNGYKIESIVIYCDTRTYDVLEEISNTFCTDKVYFGEYRSE